MKMKNLFSGILMAATLALGIGAAVSFESKSNNDVKVAEAADTKKVFLDCTQHSGYDDAQSIGIQYYVNSYIKKEAIKVSDNYWYVDVPSNVTKVQFFRCDTGNVNKNYNWQWEGDGSVNYYSVKGWDNNGDWSAANGADETYTVASTTPTASTKRIWVDPKQNFYDAGARAALRVFDGGTPIITYILGGSGQYVSIGSEAYIFFVDININYDCQLVRLHNVFNIVWSYGHNISAMDGYNTTKIVYQWSTNPAVDYSCGNESDPTVEYAKKVLDGYSTCVDSNVNGYGAYSELNTNILSKLDASELSQLRSATFSDPTYGTRTYGDKIDLMANPRSSGRTIVPNGLDNNSNAIVGIIASLTIVASLGGYFLLKKKRI